MCIAILRPAKARHVSDTELDNCKDNNWDGFGYAFVAYDQEKEENFVVVKRFLTFKPFLKELREDEQIHIHTPFMIHFRATSAGANSLENCHPFQVNRHQAFCHNGTMFSVPLAEKRSDTNIFNEDILKSLPEDWLDNEGIKTLVDNYVSPGKVIVLNSDFSFEIFGEKKGHWFEQIWWSNSDYKFNRRYQGYSYNQKAFTPNSGGHGKITRTTTYYTGNQQYRKTMYEDGHSSTVLVNSFGFKTGANKNLDKTGVGSEDTKKEKAPHRYDYLFSEDEEIDNSGEGIKALLGYTEEGNTHFNCGFCGMGFDIKDRTTVIAGGYEHSLCPGCHEDYEGLHGYGFGGGVCG